MDGYLAHAADRDQGHGIRGSVRVGRGKGKPRGGGVSDDFHLAWAYAHLRTLRLADGPDEVHKLSIARRELAPYIPREEAPSNADGRATVER